MSILNKVENAYLTILRLVVLTGATLALISAIILGASAASKLLSTEPKAPPDLVTAQNTPKLDAFLASNKPEARAPKNAESSKKLEEKTQNPDLVASARNISQYAKDVFQGDLDHNQALDIFIEKSNTLPEQTRKSYFKSANEFSAELLKKVAEQKVLVATSRDAGQEVNATPGFLNVDAALQWHLIQFAEIVDNNNAEIAQKQQEYVFAKAAGTQELYIAAGSFVTFLLVVFLFIIIKIERNLRGVSAIKES
ncbi:MAG: hypothetical protein PHD68_04995 [Rugosibacter sp.]|nr:hypothetical protein [Rugosibacter sp.]